MGLRELLAKRRVALTTTTPLTLTTEGRTELARTFAQILADRHPGTLWSEVKSHD